MTNVLSNLSCETLYNMYRTYVESLQSLVQDARNMLRNISELVSFPFRRINALISEYVSALNNLPSLLDFSNLNQVISALKRMLDCPILADAFGSQIANILDNVGQSAGLIKSMVQSLLQSIADKVTSAMAPVQAMLQKPLSSVISGFENFAGQTLGPVFGMLNTLQECLGNMCAAYKAVQSFSPGAIVKPLERFGVSFSGGTMKFDSNTMVNAMVRKVTDIKDRTVKDFDSMRKSTLAAADDAVDKARDLKNKAIKITSLAGDSSGG